MSFNPRKGIEPLREAAQRKGGGDFPTLRFIRWEDGEEKTLRFLTDLDELLTVGLHDQVPCHDNVKRSFICRAEFTDDDGNNLDCELCKHENERARKTKNRGYGVAVLREAIRDDDGKITGYQDVTEEVEVEKDGEKTMKVVPVVGIIGQGPVNFWSQIDAVSQRLKDQTGDESILQQDIDIRRRGDKLDTQYHAFPTKEMEIPIKVIDEDFPTKAKAEAALKKIEDKHEGFDYRVGGEGKEWHIEEQAQTWRAYLLRRFEKFTPNLEEFLAYMGSQEFYDQKIRGKEPEGSEESGGGDNGKAPRQPEEDEETEFEKLKQRSKELKAGAASGDYE